MVLSPYLLVIGRVEKNCELLEVRKESMQCGTVSFEFAMHDVVCLCANDSTMVYAGQRDVM